MRLEYSINPAWLRFKLMTKFRLVSAGLKAPAS